MSLDPDRERSLRLRAEEALQTLEERLRTLLDHAPVILWAMDAKGIVTLSEGKGLAALGFKPGELVGRATQELYTEPHLVENNRRALAGEAFTSVDAVGDKVLETRFTPRFDAQRRLVGVVAVSVDVTERTRAEEALRGLSRRLWSLQEAERRRIARELHDEAGQSITALKMNLDRARRENDGGRVRALVEEAAELAAHVRVELGRIAQDLKPAALSERGLVPALRALLEGFRHRTGVEFELTESGNGPPPVADLGATAETTVFRFVQEALTNVSRHARARSVRVALEREDGIHRVTVADDGVGFDVGSALARNQLGLLGMRERARMLGGQVRIDSEPGRGARLTIELPARC